MKKNNKPIIFGFYGESNTGKTKVISEIIKILTDDGYKIAAVKKTDKKINIDQTGKDTFKFSNAGSKLTILSSKHNTDFLVNRKMNILDIIDIISNIGKFDVIFIEGANYENIPKIRFGDIKKRENTIIDYNNNLKYIINLIKDEIKRFE